MEKRKYKMLEPSVKMKCGNQTYEMYQIQALVDIPAFGIIKGHLGGWIDEDGALSHEGNCWIGVGSIVANHSHVGGNAQIKVDSIVMDYSIVRDDVVIIDSTVVQSQIVQESVVSKSKIEDSYLSEKTKIRESEVEKLTMKSGVVASSKIRSNKRFNAMYKNFQMYDSEFFYDGVVEVDIVKTCNIRNCSLHSVSSFVLEKALDIKNVNSSSLVMIKSTGSETSAHSKNTLGAFHSLTLEKDTWIDVEDSIIVLDGTIKGLIRFRKCNIHNYGKIENRTHGGLLLHNCVVNDLCVIEKIKDSTCTVKGLVLSGEDKYLID